MGNRRSSSGEGEKISVNPALQGNSLPVGLNRRTVTLELILKFNSFKEEDLPN